MVKLTTRYGPNSNKFYGYKFNGRIYKTEFMLNRATNKWFKRNPRKRVAPIAKPVYVVKKAAKRKKR
ncbi:MAG: hypothetical protein KAU20_07810 [Nanoarchaeota archaeon]|nr:hypothetical protein [Nanoarchaeota archaeon]